MSKYRGYIAIDLGTTNSVVSHIKADGSIELIKNQDGDYLTPSFVWFDESITDGSNNTLIGKKAKLQMKIDPKNVMSCYKPHMGSGKPIKIISLPGRSASAMKAETCSKLVLRHLKRGAEAFLGDSIDNVVVTVPARFTDPQRNATQLCCTAAGLNVTKIISEPTAAAYHYGINSQNDDDEKVILAYDLGGGTFDASVILNTGTDTSVAGTEGDIHLGGDDIDKAFAALIFKNVAVKGLNYSDLHEDIQEMFVREAESAKVALCDLYEMTRSENQKSDYNEDKKFEKTITVTVNLKGFAGRLSELGVTKTQVTMSFADFRKVAMPFIERTINITRNLVNSLEDEGKVFKSEVTDVLLVGGSSRIPIVRELLIKLINAEQIGLNPAAFDSDYFSKYLTDPDWSVSLGAAAYMKAILDGEEYKIADIVPLPIGIWVIDEQTGNSKMEVVIARGSMLPAHCMHPKIFTNINAGEDHINIKVCEGVSTNPNDNYLLGIIPVPLNKEQQARAKSASVKVQIGVNRDGIIEVAYTDLINLKKGKLIFDRQTDLSGADVEVDEVAENEMTADMGETNNDSGSENGNENNRVNAPSF